MTRIASLSASRVGCAVASMIAASLLLGAAALAGAGAAPAMRPTVAPAARTFAPTRTASSTLSRRSVPLVGDGRLRGGEGEPGALNGSSTGVVIDAGSSGSRVYVYRWDSGDPEGTIVELAGLRIQPGVSEVARSAGAHAAAESLRPLLEFVLARGIEPSETPVYFMATAGLRLLEPTQQREVLDAVRALIAQSAFLSPQGGSAEVARVIDGEEEALFDWLAVNTALRRVGGPPERTAAVADLGGASTQLAFATTADAVPRADQLVSIGRARVLGVSRLGLGMNEALSNMLGGPSRAEMGACLAPGERATTADGLPLEGSGDYRACRAAIGAYLHEYETARRAEEGAAPTLPARGQWPVYLLDNFAKGAAILVNATAVPLEATFTLMDLEALGQHVCAVPASQLAFLRPHPTAQERKPCFLGAFMAQLLEGVYGFPRGHAPDGDSSVGTLKLVQAVNGFSMNWSLGAMVYEARRARGLPAT